MFAWQDNSQTNQPLQASKLSRYLKIMTYMAILPIESKTEMDIHSNTFKVKVEVKKWRGLIMVMTDLLVMLISLGGIILFHEINGDLNDGMTSIQRLFGFQYYLNLFNGVKTDTAARLALWFSPFFMSYPFLKSGWTIGKNLNTLLDNDWFKMDFRLGRLSTISLILYSVGWFLSNYSVPLHPRNWAFFILTICTSITGIRFALFWYFLETLLFGLLKGWKIKRPHILIIKGSIVKNSFSIIEEFKDWINRFQKIERCFKTFLFFDLLIMLPMMTLYLYLFITQIVSGGGSPDTVYYKYAWLVCMIIAMHSRQYYLAKKCNDAFDEIEDARTDIIMKATEVEYSNEEVLHKLKTILCLISSAKPLNGNGYFKVQNATLTSVAGALTTYLVVLIQFNITERGGV